jgi:hypothetical protein
MYGPQNIAFINAQQAEQTYQYKNIKETQYRTVPDTAFVTLARRI